MKCLGGDYEVEEGNGGDRNQYLKDHQIKTYLVVAPDEFHDVSVQEHNCDVNIHSISLDAYNMIRMHVVFNALFLQISDAKTEKCK